MVIGIVNDELISILGGDTSKFVPPFVGERLKAKIQQLGGK